MTHRNNNNNMPNGEITDHIAVVTGSSSGIGFEIALMLARNGFQHMQQCAI